MDNASTTITDELVIEAMKPYFNQAFGNPSSLHSYGTHAHEHLEYFRTQIASFLNCQPEELIFNSGGTEGNNTVLKGVAFANIQKGNHIIVSQIEHDSILHTCEWLEEQGFSISYIPVDEDGIVDIEAFINLIEEETILVSVMHVNNETGAIQPIEEIGKICKLNNILFHTDACQSFGKIPFDVESNNISLATLNAHKINGPKGVGCLYIKKGTPITPLLHGGGQEMGFRSTTENLAGIAGFAKAAKLRFEHLDALNYKLESLSKKLIQELENRFEGFYLNSSASSIVPGIINFGISGFEGETIRLLLLLDEQGIAVSTGSACSNNDTTKSASHVLKAMGRDAFQARGAIRIGLGTNNEEEDINYFLEKFEYAFQKLNSIYT